MGQFFFLILFVGVESRYIEQAGRLARGQAHLCSLPQVSFNCCADRQRVLSSSLLGSPAASGPVPDIYIVCRRYPVKVQL